MHAGEGRKLIEEIIFQKPFKKFKKKFFVSKFVGLMFKMNNEMIEIGGAG